MHITFLAATYHALRRQLPEIQARLVREGVQHDPGNMQIAHDAIMSISTAALNDAIKEKDAIEILRLAELVCPIGGIESDQELESFLLDPEIARFADGLNLNPGSTDPRLDELAMDIRAIVLLTVIAVAKGELTGIPTEDPEKKKALKTLAETLNDFSPRVTEAATNKKVREIIKLTYSYIEEAWRAHRAASNQLQAKVCEAFLDHFADFVATPAVAPRSSAEQ